jgi:C1A family cysteine protease
MTLKDYDVSWQLINHSILIIGWGVENGQKYWLCQNSYGGGWGDNGYFKIRRGMNDYGIESEPSWYIPKLAKNL